MQRAGLAYDWADVGIITNIQPDHIGVGGIRDLDDLVHIKSLVAERVREGFRVALIGAGRTREILLTARLIGTEEAQAVGLISESVDDFAAVRPQSANPVRVAAGSAGAAVAAGSVGRAGARARERGADPATASSYAYLQYPIKNANAINSGEIGDLTQLGVEAVDAIVAGQSAGGRGQVRAACGTGKTIVALHAARRLCPTGLVVIACPSLPLLAQTLAVWAGTSGATHVLAVCGDDSVADVAVHATDLPCPVTTRREEITRWLRDTPGGQPRLILVTHTSAGVLGDGLTAADTTADLLIVDEAHHTAGWNGKHNTLIHHDDRLPATRRLYLSATPRLRPARRTTRTSDDDPIMERRCEGHDGIAVHWTNEPDGSGFWSM